MSLVGTRPPTVDEFEQYEGYHKRRLSMTPGLTGVWQGSGRSDITDFEEIVSMDVEYIKNWSLKRDIEIILKTILVVFNNSGAKQIGKQLLKIMGEKYKGGKDATKKRNTACVLCRS